MADPPGQPGRNPGGPLIGARAGPNETIPVVTGTPTTAWTEVRAPASLTSASAVGAASAAAAHALYILLDSNLPTGGFVASSGLESAAKHGCLRERGYGAAGGVDLHEARGSRAASAASGSGSGTRGHNGLGPAVGDTGRGEAKGTRSNVRGGTFGTGSAAPRSAPPLGPRAAAAALTAFADAEVHNFEASTGWYLRQAHGVAARVRAGAGAAPGRGTSPPAALGEGGPHPGNDTNDDKGNDTTTTTPAASAVAAAAVADAVDAADADVDAAVTALTALDAAHDATLLSHVARRASRAQGIALLTLFVRGMGPPPGFDYDNDVGGGLGAMDGLCGGGQDYLDAEADIDGAPGQGAASAGADLADADARARAHALVSAYKLAIRRGSPGHLALCFGVVAAALGIDLETTRHLYLFTHARSLLSSAVRLNIVGPYLSTQLLAHPLRRVIRDAMRSSGGGGGVSRRPAVDGHGPGAGPGAVANAGTDRKTDRPRAGDTASNADADASRPDAPGKPNGANLAGPVSDPWDWADDAERGPATTWPLGEILAARHDLQHSRIFNS